MSDTPRTDAAIQEGCLYNYVPIEFTEELERECDRLARQCVKNVEELGQIRAALEKEERRRLGAEACLESWKEDEGADAARLEFVCARSNGEFYSRGAYYELTRESIDAAMEERNK